MDVPNRPPDTPWRRVARALDASRTGDATGDAPTGSVPEGAPAGRAPTAGAPVAGLPTGGAPAGGSRWRRVARSLVATRRRRVLVGLVVALVAVRVALPYIVRRVAVDQANKALVGRVELDDVDLSLVTGGVTLHGLRVFAGGDADAAPVFAADRLGVGVRYLALFRKILEVKRFELDG